jgi:hypothetical protein
MTLLFCITCEQSAALKSADVKSKVKAARLLLKAALAAVADDADDKVYLLVALAV